MRPQIHLSWSTQSEEITCDPVEIHYGKIFEIRNLPSVRNFRNTKHEGGMLLNSHDSDRTKGYRHSAMSYPFLANRRQAGESPVLESEKVVKTKRSCLRQELCEMEVEIKKRSDSSNHHGHEEERHSE